MAMQTALRRRLFSVVTSRGDSRLPECAERGVLRYEDDAAVIVGAHLDADLEDKPHLGERLPLGRLSAQTCGAADLSWLQ